MSRLRLRLTPSSGVLIGLVALGLAAISADRGTLAAAAGGSFGLLAALAVAASVLVRRPRRRHPWLLLSGGMLSLGLGDVGYGSGWGAVPVDSLYVAGLTLGTLSLVVLVAAGSGHRAARMLFVDVAAVFVAAMTALWIFVFDAKFDSLGDSTSARFDVMAFPVLDLFLIALALRLTLTSAVRTVSYRLLLAGVVVGGGGDLLWRALGIGGYTVWVSGSYYAALVLLAAAALRPSMRDLVEVNVPEEETLTRLRVLFLGCSLVVVPIVLATHLAELQNDLKDFAVTGLAATVIPLLVGYRLVDLARIARATAAALRGSEELYRSVVEGSPSLICLLDTEARVVYMSPAAEALTGYTNEEAKGQSVWSLLRPDVPPSSIEDFPAAAAGGPMERRTIRAKTKAGDELYLDGSLALVHVYGDRTGDLILAIAQDATKEVQEAAARVALEKRLQQAEKMESIGQLAGGVAHDFNNLLLAMRGYCELAVRDLETRDLDAAERDIREVLQAADSAADLTRQLLAFGRRQVLMPELLELGKLIGDTAGRLGPLLHPRIELHVLPADRPVLVRVDRSQLTQVITNLAINARDAMPAGGTLTIAAETAETEALLTIADTGTGMGDETVAQIFEPFFTTKAEKGMGMGLATVQGIVDQSGGAIDVETQPGKGSRFTIRLPLVPDEQAAGAGVATAGAEDALLAGTIMLVEDTPVVRAVVRAFLEADGYQILEAEGGEEALELARAHEGPIDIVLTDIVLPGIDGKQTAEELRREHPDADVLYMSGYTNDPDLQAGRLPPRTAFIQKPFTADQLREALHGLVAVA